MHVLHVVPHWDVHFSPQQAFLSETALGDMAPALFAQKHVAVGFASAITVASSKRFFTSMACS